MSSPETLPNTPKVRLAFGPDCPSSKTWLPAHWNFSRSRFLLWRSAAVGVILSLLLGCGAVGKPIAPEDVGIEAKIKKQERESKGEQETPSPDETVPVTEQPEELPSFYPIGVR